MFKLFINKLLFSESMLATEMKLIMLTDWQSPQYSGHTFREKCTFHTDYLTREYLFSISLGSFKNRHFKISIAIFLMYVR